MEKMRQPNLYRLSMRIHRDILEFYSDPKNVQEFEKWKEEREKNASGRRRKERVKA